MDFIIEFPSVQNGYNVFWVIVDKLTEKIHFLLIKDTTFIDQLGKLYVKEIVRLHRVLRQLYPTRTTNLC